MCTRSDIPGAAGKKKSIRSVIPCNPSAPVATIYVCEGQLICMRKAAATRLSVA